MGTLCIRTNFLHGERRRSVTELGDEAFSPFLRGGGVEFVSTEDDRFSS